MKTSSKSRNRHLPKPVHNTPRFIRVLGWVALLWVLTLLLFLGRERTHGAPLPLDSYAPPEPTQYHNASSPFDVISPTVSISVPLGTKQPVQLKITNRSTETLSPVLYEAHKTPPPGAAPRLSIAPSLQRVALPDQTDPVDEKIFLDLAASDDGSTDFLVFLQDQPDLSEAYHIADWGERGWFVYRTLYDHAQRSQRSLRAWLDARATPYESFWIVNALVVHGTEDDVQALAARKEVALLRANRVATLDGQAYKASVSNCNPDENQVCWNIQNVRADDVWHVFGISGQGITVANMDSGVRFDHPALVQQYRGYSSQQEDVFRHTYNWFDAIDGNLTPIDSHSPGHGTHTMGTMVARGDGSEEQPALGVAPGARWIAARACSVTTCSERDLIESAEWLLAPRDPDDEHPRPDLRPHVVNNSWASDKGGLEQYVEFTAAWRAAGIFPAFAAGNKSGDFACSTVASPGDYENVMGVGATDRNDSIASFSRVGPTKDGRLKPDISAPGQSIASTTRGDGLSYGSLNGTSMATPHVAGAVALLWSANPTLIGNYEATYQLLTQHAEPRTDSRFTGSQFESCQADTVPNNIYGYGRLDAYATVAAAQVDVPWLELPATPLGVLDPGESQTFTLSLDMRQVAEAGTYEARVLIGTGDLSQTPLSIPITATVLLNESFATVGGVVLDQQTDAPLQARVHVSDGPQSIEVDDQGAFEIKLPTPRDPYTYTVTVQSTGYVSQSVVVPLRAGMHQQYTFRLVFQEPHLAMPSQPLSTTLDYGDTSSLTVTLENTGTMDLSYRASVLPGWYGAWRSDSDHDGDGQKDISYEWVSLPSRGTVVKLEDDDFSEAIALDFPFPMGDKEMRTVSIGSNGLLVFDGLKQTEHFIPRCLPVAETDNHALIPLRIDLDPSQGGSVSYAQTDDMFVVTYDGIPLHDQPDRVFTFQVVLRQDGSMMFNYQHITDVPYNASAGVQLSKDEVQTLGCGATTPITSELSLELRPQTKTSRWLELVGGEREGLLKPGKKQDLSLIFRGVSRNYAQTALSMLVVESNDEDWPVVRLPLLLTTNPIQAQIVVTNTQGVLDVTNAEGLHVRLDIPAGAVDKETRIVYTELATPGQHPPAYGYAGHAFRLEAYQEGKRMPDLRFEPPLMLTLGYDETMVSEQEESLLRLFYLNVNPWTDAAVEPYGYRLTANAVQVDISSPGEFGLFHEPVVTVYLPMVEK